MTVRNRKDHVCKVVQSPWVGIRKVGHLRKFLNPLSSEKLVHAIITSHLDYCNIVYYPAYQTRTYPIFNGYKMHQPESLSVPNDGISRLLQDLKLLPVHMWVKFKILTMYKCIVPVLLLTIFVNA